MPPDNDGVRWELQRDMPRILIDGATSKDVLARVEMLPGTEDADVGGVGGTDVGVRESPAAVVCGGALWGWCRLLWARCRGYVSVISVDDFMNTALRRALSPALDARPGREESS